MAFWDSPKDKIIKKIMVIDRRWKRLVEQGDTKGFMQEMKKIDPLMAELYSACLEDTAMAAFLEKNKLGKSEFMATRERLSRLGISWQRQAVAISDPKIFSYVLQETNDTQLQQKLM
jgi:hypothetical protein